MDRVSIYTRDELEKINNYHLKPTSSFNVSKAEELKEASC